MLSLIRSIALVTALSGRLEVGDWSGFSTEESESDPASEASEMTDSGSGEGLDGEA